MGECFEHAQAEHLSFAQAQAERLLIRNGRVLLIIAQAEHLSFAQAQAEHLQTRNGRVLLSIAQAEHLSFAQAQAEHLQNSLRECIQRFSQTILTPLADHFRSSLIDYCNLDPLGACGHEDDRSCVVNQ